MKYHELEIRGRAKREGRPAPYTRMCRRFRGLEFNWQRQATRGQRCVYKIIYRLWHRNVTTEIRHDSSTVAERETVQ